MILKFGLQLQNTFTKAQGKLSVNSFTPLNNVRCITSMKCSTSDNTVEKLSYPSSLETLINRSLYSSEKVKKVVSLLIENEVSVGRVRHLLQVHHNCLDVEASTWRRRASRLMDHVGFTPPQAYRLMLAQRQPLASSTCTAVRDAVSALNSFHASNGQAAAMIDSNPLIIQVPVRSLLSRYNELAELFQKADLLAVTKKNPSLLTDQWNLIKQRFDYVYHNLGFDQRQMKTSSVLSLDIDFIRTRHLFLQRCGAFEKPGKHSRCSDHSMSISSIFDTTDKQFLNIACDALTSATGMACVLDTPQLRAFQDSLEYELRPPSLDDEYPGEVD